MKLHKLADQMAGLVAAALLTLWGAPAVAADVIYHYEGSIFTTYDGSGCSSDCRISGDIVLSAPLAPDTPAFSTPIIPVSFSFTDGITTIDTANSQPGKFGSTSFALGTNSAGQIVQWNNQMFSATNFMFSSTNPPGCMGCSVTDQSGDFAETYFMRNSNSPGVWTSSLAGVPEPSMWAMILLGVGAIGAARRVAGRQKGMATA